MRRLSAFLTVLFCLWCFMGCSAGGRSSAPSTTFSDRTPPTSSITTSSDTDDQKEGFEPDPATTEFAIDRTLAQAVRMALGLPEGTPLTSALAATVTELSLWDGVRIKTLAGISHFTALQRLTVTGTDCQDIKELTQMPSLTRIDISWSYITDIPDFSGCPYLTELFLTAGCITDITPLCKASSLRIVNLSDNNIVSIAPLKEVTFLEGLCLEGNGIVDYAAIRDNSSLCQALNAISQSPVTYALETEERAKAVVQEQTDASMTPETKLVRLYAYVIDHTVYNDSPRRNRPFGYWALCKGRGVCGDYAEALCLLARHAGLTCQVVCSNTHAFNAVELNGNWYLLDSLWDDTMGELPTDGDWLYFGFTTEIAMAEPDHVYDTRRYPVAKLALPKAAGADWLTASESVKNRYPVTC